MKLLLPQKALVLAGGLSLAAANPAFDWDTVIPSTELDYSPCYNNTLKCAKLLLPLDWLDADNPKRVTLAIAARPATVNETDPTFGGTIIVNPGGPSGSGVTFMQQAGEIIQRTASSDTHKFEILAFDPRGVGYTKPSSDCHHNEFARRGATLVKRGLGSPDNGDHIVKQYKSLMDAFGALCAQGLDGDDDIRKFMSSSSVARDMVEIVDKLAKSRRKSSLEGDDQTRLKEDSTARINFWGFSYGAILGNYFASMFPGRVGRMALEGIEDLDNYRTAVGLPCTLPAFHSRDPFLRKEINS
jgi:pimeloyl-ACP methyl ester carboxylesterase